MPSKKFDLEKSLAKKTLGRLAQSGTPPRFGAATDAEPALDRRERRRLDQAAGLVAFAVKLPGPLVASITAAAEREAVSPGEWLAQHLPAWLESYHGPKASV